MEHKTKGIILWRIKYKDTSDILHIYTSEFGRESYLIYHNNGKKSLSRNAFLQPFTVVEMEVLHKNESEIQRIKEIRSAFPLSDLLFNPIKSSIALFLSEILYRTLKSNTKDFKLFEFLENSIYVLDLLEKNYANFHLVFLIQLTRYLGYYPNTNIPFKSQQNLYFDLQNSIFSFGKPLHNHFIPPEDAILLQHLMRMDYENMHLFSFSRQERNSILTYILEYYELHLPNFSEIKSFRIFKDLFDNL